MVPTTLALLAALACQRPASKVDSAQVDTAPEGVDPVECGAPPCWVPLPAGRFDMGSGPGQGDDNERPLHAVDLEAFEVLRTEVTVAQYSACVDDGACAPRADPDDVPHRCNWDEPDKAEHPMNCVSWFMADAFCAWAGGALPSEAQWEYAARSGGLDREYPWGEAEPSCELAVLKDTCGSDGTWPVCSHPEGNTEQGLCDMAGNAFEWVADWHHDTYEGAPSDGEPWVEPEGVFRGLRGGGIGSDEGYRTRNRTFHEPDFFYSGMGFRCAR
ncbi:MAG: SUMF1/EgtB/PvdO family nonheme iron enzyme [Alphaproteobacteria bacterium]|nr:SUMF1/EgtB/PvdO family nonheme iron enzyme [Alphaproteobacteria bacterium]